MVRLHWILALLLTAGLVFVGCGDDSGSSPSDTGADTDAGADVPGETAVCGEATACRGNGDCSATEFCNAGCCEEREVDETCTAQDEACTGDNWSNDNFVCDTGLGQCLTRCDSTTTLATEPDACVAGSWCFELAEPEEDQLDGVCLSGDCNDSCFDPASCPNGTAFSCDDGAGTCVAFGNSANFCLAAGDVEEGGDCVSGSEEPEDACVSGLFCFNGECLEPCAVGSSTNSCGDDECVPVFDQTGSNSPGICGTECDAFSAGQCGENQICEVQVGSFSGTITAWFCSDLATDDGDPVPVVGSGEPCDADSEDGLDSQCPEGHQCIVNFEDDVVGTCRQFCDSTLALSADLASCPEAESTPVLLDQTENPVTVSFDTFSAPQAVAAVEGANLRVTADDDGASLATLNDVDIEADTAVTFVAHLTDSGSALAQFLDLTDATPDLGEGLAGVRVYNVSGIDMDAYRADVLVEGLSTDDDQLSDFVSVDLNDGSTIFHTTVGDEAIQNAVSEAPTATSAEVIVMAPETGDDPAQALWFPNDAPDGTSDGGSHASVRVVNASLNNPLISVDFPETENDVEDLAYGGATAGDVDDWFTTPVGGEATVNITVDVSWGETADCEAEVPVDCISHSLTLSRADVMTLVVWDGLTGDTILTELSYSQDTPPEVLEGDDIALRLLTLLSEQTSYLIEGELLGSVVSGATLPTDDGLLEVDPGLFSIAFRVADDELTVPPELFSDVAADLVEDAAAEVFVYLQADNAGPIARLTNDATAPDLGTLGEGEAFVRFGHLADGVGDIFLEYRGEVLQVCAPLNVAGLGRCSDSCSPYLDGVPFSDASGVPTERWLTNGCTHTDDINYACLPFITTNQQEIPIELPGPPDLAGFCTPRSVPDDGFGNFNAICTNEGDAVCNPDAFCVGVTETTAECIKLCRSYSGAAHSDCNYTLEQDGSLSDVVTICQAAFTVQDFGFCQEATLNSLVEGDECTEAQAGQSCASDDTFCISAPNEGYECRRICKKEIDTTCPGLPGDERARSCRDDLAFNPPVPEYVSICGFAN